MCNSKALFGERLSTCCDPWDEREVCTQANYSNTECSEPFSYSHGNFYTYCPDINAGDCGLPVLNDFGTNMVLEASIDTQTFKFGGLRYSNAKKVSCYYQIKTPNFYYKTGQLKIKVT